MSTLTQTLPPLAWLAGAPRHTRGVRTLQICIGLVLTFRVATEAPFAAYLWGPTGIATNTLGTILGPAIGGVFDALFATPLGTYAVLGALAAAGLSLLFGYRPRAACALALVTFLAVEFRMTALGDGGDNVIRIVLVYLLFTVPNGKTAQAGSLAAWMHNVAIAAIVAQICVIYATSGLMKTFGEVWHQGTAMYYISQVEWVSLPGLRDLFKNPLITTVATYVPMLFMVTFPIAIFSRLKPLYVAMGFGFHLGIAVMMGLLTFSTAMVGLELFLLNDREYAKLDEWAGRAKQTGRAVVASLTTRARPAPAPVLQSTAVAVGDGADR